jgi:hypothetical protein
LLVQFAGIHKEIHIDILCRLRDAVRRKRPQKCRTNSWFLIHDNAPAHQLDLVKDFLAKNNVTTPKHHPHSPDLDPADFYLFSRLKSALETQRLDATDITKNATEQTKRFHKMTSRNFSTAFRVTGRSVSLHKGNILKEL